LDIFVLVLIRKKNNSAELVLLDHGLYQYVPDNERQGLCNLWKSIVLHDYKGMEMYSKQLGVDGEPLLNLFYRRIVI